MRSAQRRRPGRRPRSRRLKLPRESARGSARTSGAGRRVERNEGLRPAEVDVDDPLMCGLRMVTYCFASSSVGTPRVMNALWSRVRQIRSTTSGLVDEDEHATLADPDRSSPCRNRNDSAAERQHNDRATASPKVSRMGKLAPRSAATHAVRSVGRLRARRMDRRLPEPPRWVKGARRDDRTRREQPTREPEHMLAEEPASSWAARQAPRPSSRRADRRRRHMSRSAGGGTLAEPVAACAADERPLWPSASRPRRPRHPTRPTRAHGPSGAGCFRGDHPPRPVYDRLRPDALSRRPVTSWTMSAAGHRRPSRRGRPPRGHRAAASPA